MSLLRATAAVNGVEVLGVAGNCSFNIKDDGLAQYLYYALLANEQGDKGADLFSVSNVSMTGSAFTFTFKSVDTVSIENMDLKGFLLAHLNKIAENYDKTKGDIKKNMEDFTIDDVIFRMNINMVGTPRALAYDTNSLQDILGKYQRINRTNIDVEEISEDNDSVTVTVSGSNSYQEAKSDVMVFLRDATRNREGGTEQMRFTPSFDLSMRNFVDKRKRPSKQMSWKEAAESFTQNTAQGIDRSMALAKMTNSPEKAGSTAADAWKNLSTATYVYHFGLTSEAKMVNAMVDNVLYGDLESLPDPTAAEKLRAIHDKYEEMLEDAQKFMQTNNSGSRTKNAHILANAQYKYDEAMAYIREKTKQIYDPVVPLDSYLSVQMDHAIKNDLMDKERDKNQKDPHTSEKELKQQQEMVDKVRDAYEKELATFLQKHYGDISAIKDEHSDEKDFDPETDPRHPIHQKYEGEYTQYINTLVHGSSLKGKYPTGGLTWKDVADVLDAYEKHIERDREVYNDEVSEDSKQAHKRFKTNIKGDARLLTAIRDSQRTDSALQTSYLQPKVRAAFLELVRENGGDETAAATDRQFDSVMSTGDKLTSNFIRNKQYDARVYDNTVTFMSELLNKMNAELPPDVHGFFKSHTKNIAEAMQEKQQWISTIREHRDALYKKYADKEEDANGIPQISNKAKSVFTDPVNNVSVAMPDKAFLKVADHWIDVFSKSIEDDANALRGKGRNQSTSLKGGRGEGTATHDPSATAEAANKSHIDAVQKFINKYNNTKTPVADDKKQAIEDEYLDLYAKHMTVLNSVNVKTDLVNEAADLYDRLMDVQDVDYAGAPNISDNPGESAAEQEPLDKGVAQEAINSTQTPAEGQD